MSFRRVDLFNVVDSSFSSKIRLSMTWRVFSRGTLVNNDSTSNETYLYPCLK